VADRASQTERDLPFDKFTARLEPSEMKTSDLARYALGICALATILAGCGVLPLSLSKGQDDTQPPIGAPGVMPQAVAIATHAERGKSWMLPEASGEDLLYVSGNDAVIVYAYPAGKLVGELNGFNFAAGQCVDKKQNVYVTSEGDGRVYEYAHGGKRRIKTLVSAFAIGCSIDPTTGNLAVISLEGRGSRGYGKVSIFANATGSPTHYQAPGFGTYYSCSYDDQGNLFVDGESPPTGYFMFAELPKGSGKFTDVALNQHVAWAGGVQWDGKHIVVGDEETPAVYQFKFNGRKGTKVGTTDLHGAQYVFQFFILGDTLIATNESKSYHYSIKIYKYPSGGNMTKTVTKGVHGTQGAAVSLASS
jgi:hypothetical protein